jgi:hypothetical protein
MKVIEVAHMGKCDILERKEANSKKAWADSLIGMFGR